MKALTGFNKVTVTSKTTTTRLSLSLLPVVCHCISSAGLLLPSGCWGGGWVVLATDRLRLYRLLLFFNIKIFDV